MCLTKAKGSWADWDDPEHKGFFFTKTLVWSDQSTASEVYIWIESIQPFTALIMQVRQRTAALEQQLATATKEREQVAREAESLRKICSQQDEQLNRVRQEHGQSDSEVARLFSLLKEAEEEKMTKDQQITALKSEIQSIQSQLERTRQEHEAEKQRAQKLSDQLKRNQQQQQSAVAQGSEEIAGRVKEKDAQITALEKALEQTNSVTMEREMLVAQQLEKLQLAEQKV